VVVIKYISNQYLFYKMKFTLAKLLTTFALVAVAASAETEAAEKSHPVLRGAIQVAAEASESVSASESASTSMDEFAPSDNTPASSDSNEDDELFPDEMNEDEEDKKNNSAQKRQSQRDARRAYDNPNRSQHEEQRERERKNNQSRRSGNACRDPNEPGCGNDNHPNDRERTRNQRCNGQGRSCNHHRVNPQDEPNRNRSATDRNCIRNCNGNSSCERRCSSVAQE